MQYKCKTLVILSPGFPENEDDTTCLPLQQTLVKEFKRSYKDLNIIVLTFQYPFKRQSYTWNGVKVQAFGGKGRGKLLRILNWIKIWRELKRLKTTHNVIGLLSFWMGECAFIGHWFGRLNGLKHHCWVCGQDAKPGNVYLNMMRPAAGEPIALSDFLAQTLYKSYHIKPQHIIAGGLDADMFEQTHLNRYVDILAAGSLIPLKQYHLFIEVVARIKKDIPHVKAVLCGDGPGRNDLLHMIKRTGLEANITLTGEIPHREVLKLMQQTKIFFHPSGYEGLGMVMVEALYAGAKVVSFVKPFNRTIKNWYCVAGTVQASAIIESMLQNDNLTFTCVAPFMINDTASAMLNLYDSSLLPISIKQLAMAPKESLA